MNAAALDTDKAFRAASTKRAPYEIWAPYSTPIARTTSAIDAISSFGPGD